MKITTWIIGLMALSLTAAEMYAVDGHGPADAKQVDSENEAMDQKIKLQTKCPVMGGAINKQMYVDHDGKRIYICCKGCETPLKKDPAKYIKQIEDEGITVARLQTECPVMDGAIDKSLYLDHEGKRIYVCCKGCIAAVKKDTAKYIKQMEDKGVALHSADKNKADAPVKK